MQSRDQQMNPHHEPTGAKEPYDQPAVISEEVFETLAMACGKTGSQAAVCGPNGGINS
jgi:hypothetical protein